MTLGSQCQQLSDMFIYDTTEGRTILEGTNGKFDICIYVSNT